MKIQDSIQRIYQGRDVQRSTPARQPERKPVEQAGAHHQQRKNIPRDFKPKVGLTRKEQTFFAQLFPAQKRQIEAYVQQQNKTVPEKGQIIDLKG